MADRIPKPNVLLIFIGTYRHKSSAQHDYKVMRHHFRQGALANYDAAVVVKQSEGRVTVSRHKVSTKFGFLAGGILGIIVGVVASPFFVVCALAGAAIGGISGHLWRYLPRSGIEELAEIVEPGMPVLLVVGIAVLEERLETAALTPETHVVTKLQEGSQDLIVAMRQAAAQLL